MSGPKYVQQDAISINQRIWLVVTQIPAGAVATYGDIAHIAGLGRAARRVGPALRRLPLDTRIPWHRVVNARGQFSLPIGSPAYRQQTQRLEAEGVLPHNANRIDLAQYRWRPGGHKTN